jgi:hypothetical protein
LGLNLNYSSTFQAKYRKTACREAVQDLQWFSGQAVGFSFIQDKISQKREFSSKHIKGARMALDFQRIREQIRIIGEQAPRHIKHLEELYNRAVTLLEAGPEEIAFMRLKAQRAVEEFDSNLRFGLPLEDSLTSCYSGKQGVLDGTLIAVDGSQIIPDLHAEINFGLINLGAVIMRYDDPGPPRIKINSQLLYENQLYTETGIISDLQFSLLRDINERHWLAELASENRAPVTALTDGPIELWGARQGEGWADFKQSLEEYKQVLSSLGRLGVTVCGYVDSPAANLVTRFLETDIIAEARLPNIRKEHPLRGVKDRVLFSGVLRSGERTGVFRLQSRSAQDYPGDLALHFFYLNVGSQANSQLVRVEIPSWVARNDGRLDNLQAVLVEQCRILGDRPYPYLLHRAHETALVSMGEKEQITQMLLGELRRRGIEVGTPSSKSLLKRL